MKPRKIGFVQLLRVLQIGEQVSIKVADFNPEDLHLGTRQGWEKVHETGLNHKRFTHSTRTDGLLTPRASFWRDDGAELMGYGGGEKGCQRASSVEL